jgi:hypothetical protein
MQAQPFQGEVNCLEARCPGCAGDGNEPSTAPARNGFPDLIHCACKSRCGYRAFGSCTAAQIHRAGRVPVSSSIVRRIREGTGGPLAERLAEARGSGERSRTIRANYVKLTGNALSPAYFSSRKSLTGVNFSSSQSSDKCPQSESSTSVWAPSNAAKSRAVW